MVREEFLLTGVPTWSKCSIHASYQLEMKKLSKKVKETIKKCSKKNEDDRAVVRTFYDNVDNSPDRRLIFDVEFYIDMRTFHKWIMRVVNGDSSE